jgi:uncharacterized protein (TIGR00252 family)
MTNFAHGREAETAAAEYLKKQGFKILAQNWRTRWCEIDIVAQKHKRVYFVEVKYRQTNKQGSGLDYITTRKLKQMQFAAEFWVQDNEWTGDYTLAAIEVSGPDFQATSFLTDL